MIIQNLHFILLCWKCVEIVLCVENEINEIDKRVKEINKVWFIRKDYFDEITNVYTLPSLDYKNYIKKITFYYNTLNYKNPFEVNSPSYDDLNFFNWQIFIAMEQ